MSRVPYLFTALTGATLTALSLAGACSDGSGPSSEPVRFFGASLDLGQGTARAWVDVDPQGTPLALGVSMTEQALSGLPSMAMPPNPAAVKLTLPLPVQARGVGVDHIDLQWNPQGHEPPQLYAAPHFDFHFYLVSTETQMAIVPNDPQFATKAGNLPASQFVPVGYVPPPGPPAATAIPQMGVHWSDTKSPERNGQPFTSTFIFGSWDGQFIFFEPMITKEFLETRPDAMFPIPQPAQWASPGSYPTAYSVRYDADTKEFQVELGGLTRRP